MGRETAKNYENRSRNGDFKRYLHGNGIDIGGGPDCLKLPGDVSGTVRLWDFKDGDAQYLHGIKDETYDFVYSSHCLEHMRDIDCAFINWLRVVKKGGFAYICVPHEVYYERNIWPSIKNKDHKWSFTVNEKSSLPNNISIRDFLKKYLEYIDVIDIRENLMNYDFTLDPMIDQTLNFEDMVCAQIDFIVRRRNVELPDVNQRYWHDYFTYYLPIRAKMGTKETIKKVIPKSILEARRKR